LIFTTVEWVPGLIPYEKISAHPEPVLDGPGFFAVLVAGMEVPRPQFKGIHLAYIGHSPRTSLRERIVRLDGVAPCINQLHSGRPGSRLVVKVGALKYVQADAAADKVFFAVERCLIFTNQPSCNMDGKKAYVGDPIRMTNIGDFTPLQSVAECLGRSE
jgi:hypothetical protein